ncbi:MAG: cobalt ECF transporter T component CbiQ [Chloroflexota bacterium]|nr:cobalt ECF transporter T component CbiQ [Chloroflexota bacterium]
MRFGFDEYVHLGSPLHRWDPRFKLIGLFVLIFAFAFVRDPRLLLAIVAVTAAIYIASRLPLSYLLTRLRYPSLFLLALVLALPFISGGDVVASLGPIDLKQEGLTSALLIATRFFCILTVGLVIFGTAPFLNTIKAMRALGLPDILTDMTLLAFRYFHDTGEYLHRMETSMRLRGFHERRISPRGVGVLAWLGGSILVRSYERSEGVYRAMILRGYGHAGHPGEEFHSCPADAVALAVTILVAMGFVVAEILI